MKKISPKIFWILGLVLFFVLIKSCDYFFDFEQKIYHISKDITQSKKNDVYVRNIKLENLKFQSLIKPLNILKFNGWIEKTTTYQGNEIKKIDEKYFSIIFELELDSKLELNKNNYGDNWNIYHSKVNSVESLLSNSNPIIRYSFVIDRDSINKPIELNIQKFPSKFHPNDSKSIGSFLLK